MNLSVGIIHEQGGSDPVPGKFVRVDQAVVADTLPDAIAKAVEKFTAETGIEAHEIMGLGVVTPRYEKHVGPAIALIEPTEEHVDDRDERMTLDHDTAALMIQLRAVALNIQKLGQRVALQDYSDGINLGQSILDFAGACSKLADKFNEVGLFDDRESFYL